MNLQKHVENKMTNRAPTPGIMTSMGFYSPNHTTYKDDPGVRARVAMALLQQEVSQLFDRLTS